MINKDKYTENFINYTGSKDRLLLQISTNLNKSSKYLVEPFCGSSVVSINFANNYEKCYCNDANWRLIYLLKWMKKNIISRVLEEIQTYIEIFDLCKTNKLGYNEARYFYNTFHKTKEDFNPALFYAIVSHSFNYFIHVSSTGGLSMPSGYGRSWFNPKLRQKLIKFHNKLSMSNIEFTDYSFNSLFDYMQAGECNMSEYMFYVDPPYLISDSSYSRIYGLSWNDSIEKQLYDNMDLLNELGGKFLLSNVVSNNGNTNTILQDWMNKYNVVEVDMSYKGCNYQRNNIGKTREVLIKNY